MDGGIISLKGIRMPSKKSILAVIIVGYLILVGITPNIVAENFITKKGISAEYEDSPKKNFLNNPDNLEDDTCIDGREYWAILIGINNYPGTQGDLPYSINEILSFKRTLLNGGNWNETHIRVLTNSQANKPAIFDAIEWLDSNADEDDISIFYYAGHGKRSSSNEYLQVYNETISDEELDEKLDEVDGKIVVILDSCYSGGFIEEVGEKGRIVLTACKKDEVTYQVHNLSSGIFGYFINISLEWLTKSAETTFLFTWFFSVYYSKRLSQEFNDDYNIHPRMYDGTLSMVRLIDHHSYSMKILSKIYTMPIENNDLNIWKM